MRLRSEYLSLAFLSVFLTFCALSLPAEEPEEVWRKLGELSGKDRQQLLLSKAKTEGEVVLYSNNTIQTLAALREDFMMRYPGVTVQLWRASGERMFNRISAEARAGRFSVDVIGGANEFLPPLMKAHLVGRYRSPERRYYPDTHKDQEGYWTSYNYIVAVIAYNTSLVSQAEAPRRYEDFLDPKWKGNFTIDTDPDRALMGWLKTWGYEKTEKFLDGLVKNEAAVRRGHTLMTQLLCAGEFKAAVELYAFRVLELKYKGCPVEMVFPDPTPGAVGPLFVAKRSRHPYGAALLVDYLLSEAGQEILAEKGFYSARPGIKLKYPEMDIERNSVNLLLLTPEDAEKLGKTYLELRERYLLRR